MLLQRDPSKLQTPTEQPTAAPSVVTTYRAPNFGDYQTLLSDLITTNPSASKLKRDSYTFDPTAIQKRLGEYSTIDAGTYNQYTPLLTQPLSGITANGNQIIKTSDLNNAIQSIQDKYGTIAKSDYDTLAGTAFKDFNPTTIVGDQAYFDKAALEQRLGNYTGLGADQLSAYRPLLGDVNPLGTLGGNQIFDKNALNQQLGRYTGQAEDWSKTYQPLLGDVKPVTTIEGKQFYDTAALQSQLGKYSQLPTDWQSKLDDSWLASQYRAKAKQVGNDYFLANTDLDYLKDPFKGVTFMDSDQWGMGYTGVRPSDSGNPNVAYLTGNSDIGPIKVFTGDAANARDFYNNPKSLFSYLDIGYAPETYNQERGYYLPSAMFNPVQGGSSYDKYAYYISKGLDPAALRKNAFYNGSGFIFPTWNNFEEAMRGSGLDPYGRPAATYEHRWVKKKGGWLADVARAIGDIVTPVTNITQFFDPTGFSQGWQAGINIGQGVATGNWGQAAIGGLGALGAVGINPSQSIGSAIGPSLGQAAQGAIGNAVIGSGLGLLSGQNLGDALKSGAVSGLGGYGGGLAGQYVGSAIGGNAGKLLGSSLGGATAGAIAAGLRGNDLGKALTSGAISGGLGGLAALSNPLTKAGTPATPNWFNRGLVGSGNNTLTRGQALSGGLNLYLRNLANKRG